MARRLSPSPEETLEFGRELGEGLPAQGIIALYGELGAGKTTFAKGLVAGVAGVSPDEVISPTFTYLQVYPGPVYHFDLYRLSGPDEFLDKGFDEYFFIEGLVVIEWPERVEPLLPPYATRITISSVGEHEREIKSDDSI